MKFSKKLFLFIFTLFLTTNAWSTLWSTLQLNNLTDIFNQISPETIDSEDLRLFSKEPKKAFEEIKRAIFNTDFRITNTNGNNTIHKLFSLHEFYTSLSKWHITNLLLIPRLKYAKTAFSLLNHRNIIKNLYSGELSTKKETSYHEYKLLRELEVGHLSIISESGSFTKTSSCITKIKKKDAKAFEKFYDAAMKLKKFYSMVLGAIMLYQPKNVIFGLIDQIRRNPITSALNYAKGLLKYYAGSLMLKASFVAPAIDLLPSPAIGSLEIGSHFKNQLKNEFSKKICSKTIHSLPKAVKSFSWAIDYLAKKFDQSLCHGT